MEAVSVGNFLVILMRNQLTDVLDLVHLFEASACRSMRVLHRHEDKQKGKVVLLDELVQELSSLLDICSKLKSSHMLLPLTELVLDHFNLLEKLHLCALLFSDPRDDLERELIPVLTLHCVRLVSIHWIVDIGVVEVLVT